MTSMTDRLNFRTELASAVRKGTRDTAYFWMIVAVFGLAAIACAVAGSYYTNDIIAVAPYVGP
jgi:hypothetical protein